MSLQRILIEITLFTDITTEDLSWLMFPVHVPTQAILIFVGTWTQITLKSAIIVYISCYIPASFGYDMGFKKVTITFKVLPTHFADIVAATATTSQCLKVSFEHLMNPPPMSQQCILSQCLKFTKSTAEIF